MLGLVVRFFLIGRRMLRRLGLLVRFLGRFRLVQFQKFHLGRGWLLRVVLVVVFRCLVRLEYRKNLILLLCLRMSLLVCIFLSYRRLLHTSIVILWLVPLCGLFRL